MHTPHTWANMYPQHSPSPLAQVLTPPLSLPWWEVRAAPHLVIETLQEARLLHQCLHIGLQVGFP